MPPQLNLDNIHKALLAFEASKIKQGSHVETRIQRLMAAYAMLDELRSQGMDLFGANSSQLILNLNHAVLFGCNTDVENKYGRALAASEERFYNGDETSDASGVTGGIADLMQWYDAHRSLDASERAAGIMIRALMSPQLFVEGNHRTSVLLASFVLLEVGKPPVVFDAECAQEYLGYLAQAAVLSRGSIVLWAKERRLRRKLAQLVARASNRKFLLE